MNRRTKIEEYGIEVPGGTVFVQKWIPRSSGQVEHEPAADDGGTPFRLYG